MRKALLGIIGLFLANNVSALAYDFVLQQRNSTNTACGLWVQLVTENNTATPTFTARPGQ